MSNYNKNDDFFTSEYDKIANNQSQRQSHVDVDGWYSYNNNSNPNKTPKKNIAVVVVSILLILAFIGGFLFSTLFKDPDPIEVPTNEILNEVIRHIEEEWLYSNDITNADWMNMVEQAGTAMLQTVDRYAQLISPQSKYDSENASITESNNSRGYFGFGYQYATFGLYIATVYADSNCYGKLQEGDLIVAFSNAYDYYGNKYEFAVTDLPQAQLINLMGTLQRCTASVLRGGEIVKVNLQRASIGNGNDEFATIEYYFGSNNTNMSTTPQNGAAISSVEARGLERLPSNVGYVRLTSFEYNVSDKEFKQVLNKFRLSGKTKLIVDLKGNPGGTVITAANIAGLLSKPAADQDFVACTLVDNAGNDEKYRPQTDYRKYDDYFGEQDGNTKDIVIWT
ncbi:MAG: hypothetical protein J6Q55_02505, partial [Clostridia bacterium]|nr:hypothetical protein [Clostridia bacterium]